MLRCARFYGERMECPSLTPWRYFHLLLIGYFEGLDGERGWRGGGGISLALLSFLGVGLNEMPRITRLSCAPTTDRCANASSWFRGMLEFLAEKDLLKEETIGIDATTLEANAALRSIARRDMGQGYQEFLMRLARIGGCRTK